MIVEAGLITFLRTVFIIMAVYFGIKFLIRYLSPLMLKWFIKKQQDKYSQNSASYNSSNNNSRKEGEVHIKKSSKERHHTDEIGDYVDYEEVNEKDNDS